MKLSFTTLGCPDWSFAKILSEAQQMGFDAIEIRGVDGVMRAEEIPLFFEENKEATEKLLAEHSLAVAGFGTSVSFHNPETFDAALEEGKAAIGVCHRMGFPFIRIFGDKLDGSEPDEVVMARVLRGIRALCDDASGTAVDILLEVHGDFNTLETILPLIAGTEDCPNFGILWDIEHSDRSYGADWRTFYEPIQHAIRHIHIKDHKRIQDGFQLTVIGEGDIPIGDIIRTTEADGYQGYYSLEWEKKWHPELPDPSVALPGFLSFIKTLESQTQTR